MQVAEFRAALRRFVRRNELVARNAGLTPRQYLLLILVKGAPSRRQEATVTELTKRMQLAQNTVTELVLRSEAAGLVVRERSDRDGRVSYVRLTPDGERRMAQAFADLTEEREALLRAIGALGQHSDALSLRPDE